MRGRGKVGEECVSAFASRLSVVFVFVLRVALRRCRTANTHKHTQTHTQRGLHHLKGDSPASERRRVVSVRGRRCKGLPRRRERHRGHYHQPRREARVGKDFKHLPWLAVGGAIEHKGDLVCEAALVELRGKPTGQWSPNDRSHLSRAQSYPLLELQRGDPARQKARDVNAKVRERGIVSVG